MTGPTETTGRRWRIAGLVSAAVWGAAGAVALAASFFVGGGNGALAVAGIVMLLGSVPFWQEARE